jgi:hypothetical protein
MLLTPRLRYVFLASVAVGAPVSPTVPVLVAQHTAACSAALDALSSDANASAAFKVIKADAALVLPIAVRLCEETSGPKSWCGTYYNSTTCCDRIAKPEWELFIHDVLTLEQASAAALASISATGDLWMTNPAIVYRTSEGIHTQNLLLIDPFYLPEACANDDDLKIMDDAAQTKCRADHPKSIACGVTLQRYPMNSSRPVRRE